MGKPWVMGQSKTGPKERGLSPIIGIVLLFGLVSVVSISLLVVGAGHITETEKQVEQEQVEQSFIQLSQTVATEGVSGDTVSHLDLEAGEYGAVTYENSATMEVNANNLEDPIRADVGTIEWENEDGTTVAYQSGAVFRDTGNETRVLSSPSVNYELDTETLNMPIYNVSGQQTLDSGTIRVDGGSIGAESEVAYMQEDNVTIRVESEYYLGWKQHFEEQAGDTIVTDYGSLDGDFGYVVAELGYTQFEDTFEDGVTHSGICDGQGGGPGGGPPGGDPDSSNCDQHGWGVSQGNPSQPLDSVVDQMINNPEGAMDSHFDGVYEEGESLPDEFENEYVLIDRDLNGDYIKADLTNGNTTLAVDGDIENTDIRVTENHPDHTLQIYANGSYLSDGADVCVDDCTELSDGSTIQIFGTSEMGIQFGTGGDPDFEGLLYAASDEERWDHIDPTGQCSEYDQLCVQAGPDIYGGIVVNTADIQGGGSVSIDMDPDIDEADVDFREDLLPPQITYINVAEHQMSVEGT
ncbi:DUF7289 family protein [Natrialba sp. SSL1]|uniref:DUF7289 family protein n=1 Tax=Natrialba sp. SSL1 TaxID=1869245 RepID=UPI0008F8369F|nr:hypothetical protein [Natrialba sp. SSL1]OIB55759.1 hypothetical protein BBD46_02810 [Natrialba sp. SSL1]